MNIIETYTLQGHYTYTLYSTGKGFKTVLEEFERIRENGKVVKAFLTERRHATLENALNSKLRPSQAMINLIESGAA